MADSYYHKESTKHLRKLRQLQPDLFASFVEFDKKAFAQGTLSGKIKELIAVALGVAQLVSGLTNPDASAVIAVGASMAIRWAAVANSTKVAPGISAA